MTDKNNMPGALLAFDEVMQDKYFERIEAELAGAAPRSKVARSSRMLNVVTNESTAAVVGPSLIVFEEQLSREERQDALDSQMYAEAVVRKLPKGTSNEQQYLAYNNALLSAGWVTQSFSRKKYVSKQLTITINEAVLQILETVIAAGSGNVLSLVASGFSKLKGDKEALKIVDAGSKSNEVIAFKAVPCITTPGGGMAMLLGGLDLVDKEYNGDFLFISYKSEGLQVFQAAGVRSFNKRMFDRKKQMIYDYIDQFSDDLYKELTGQ